MTEKVSIWRKTSISPFSHVIDVVHRPRRLLPEGDEGVLVHDQGVAEHVAPGSSQQVHLLQAVQLQLVEPGLALLYVALNLK